MRKMLPAVALIAALGISTHMVQAAPVVELFTSQGCSSCPPADELLGEIIAAYPEVVALEFHVDYWDDLNYGQHGVWRDPFSQAEFSERQRNYNLQPLAGRAGVYTPQMIINGSIARVGNQRNAVEESIPRDQPSIPLSVSHRNNQLEITVGGNPQGPATLWLAKYDRQQSTTVTAGENNERVLVNHHVVRSMEPLLEWSDSDKIPASPLRFVVPKMPDQGGCAVLLQDRQQAVMLAAAYCDSEEAS